MKKLLIATTALTLAAGAAAANDNISLAGDARMGVTNNNTDREIQFTSRARVTFNFMAKSSGGLEFGASFRADNAGAAAGNTAMTGGSVYISGMGHKLAMGDVDSAANALVGHVSATSLTGLGDKNELGYLGNDDTAALYTFTHDSGFSAALSLGQPNDGVAATKTSEARSIAVKYDNGTFFGALGYEETRTDDQTSIAVGGSFSGVAVKLVAADRASWADMHYALSLGYSAGSLSATAFYAEKGAVDSHGIGASYDLGGGLSVVGGYAKDSNADSVFDLGLSMKF